MKEKVKGQLTNVSETLLITLWAKAVESKRKNPIIRDEKAVEMMERIDYDFSKFKKSTLSQVGCCVRADLIDKEAKSFLSKYPDAVVVQLGAGLDARYERLGKPSVTHWYDLDLPEAIAIRKELLQESEHNTYLAIDIFDDEWINVVKAHGKPVLIISEGVLMYFSPLQVKALYQKIAEQLPSATCIFDMLAYVLVNHGKYHDTLSKMGKDVIFKWSLLDVTEMETWHPRITVDKILFMSDYDRGRYPALFRFLYRFRYFYRRYNQRVVKVDISDK